MWKIINKFFGKKLEETESDTLLCPNCKHDKWIQGPGGGSFGNIQCGSCNTKYNNMGPFGLQKIN